MRKVIFKTWIPVEFNITDKGESFERKVRIAGTGCYSKEFSEVGLFHQWINSSEECNGDVITYVVAIVEKLNGEILELPSNAVRFTDTSSFF